jgi:hypothetical protein
VLVLLCAALAVIQNTSSKSWWSSQQAQGIVIKPGMLGRETGFLVASCVLLVIHLAYALASAVVLPGLPFHTAHHAAMALVWLIMVSGDNLFSVIVMVAAAVAVGTVVFTGSRIVLPWQWCG